jgi:gamma-glutamylcyclotransferase (GGCT)/AIG2-like uncharacterized protein YtfP
MATDVFVYGTLRTGEGNWKRYLDHEGAKLVSACEHTWPEFGFVSLGGYPALLTDIEGEGIAVVGEVYTVDAPTLRALDRLEGHPSFYLRRKIKLASGMVVSAYTMSAKRLHQGEFQTIPHGDWLRYARGARDAR